MISVSQSNYCPQDHIITYVNNMHSECQTVFLLLCRDWIWCCTLISDNWRAACCTSDELMNRHLPPPGLVLFLWVQCHI